MKISPKVFDVIMYLNWNLKSTNCLILESKEDVMLKFGQLIKYNRGKIEENMLKNVPETSPRPLFNLCK